MLHADFSGSSVSQDLRDRIDAWPWEVFHPLPFEEREAEQRRAKELQEEYERSIVNERELISNLVDGVQSLSRPLTASELPSPDSLPFPDEQLLPILEQKRRIDAENAALRLAQDRRVREERERHYTEVLLPRKHAADKAYQLYLSNLDKFERDSMVFPVVPSLAPQLVRAQDPPFVLDILQSFETTGIIPTITQRDRDAQSARTLQAQQQQLQALQQHHQQRSTVQDPSADITYASVHTALPAPVDTVTAATVSQQKAIRDYEQLAAEERARYDAQVAVLDRERRLFELGLMLDMARLMRGKDNQWALKSRL
eukprot:TRINITY_DN13989_c0_g1_i1.p1 TRINITY_DN13989_c0_g1~~TRINITY_DN13989_c0_g1_i1.p1  ORF type:complete len:313 (-),score=78.02 TRINITY_DN13989_c0_g1_i1:512-1450(-)